MIDLYDGYILSLLCKNIDSYIEKYGKIDIKSENLPFSENFLKKYEPFILHNNLRKVCISLEPYIIDYMDLISVETIVKKFPIKSMLMPQRWKIMKNKKYITKIYIENVDKYNVLIKLLSPDNRFEIKKSFNGGELYTKLRF